MSESSNDNINLASGDQTRSLMRSSAAVQYRSDHLGRCTRSLNTSSFDSWSGPQVLLSLETSKTPTPIRRVPYLARLTIFFDIFVQDFQDQPRNDYSPATTGSDRAIAAGAMSSITRRSATRAGISGSLGFRNKAEVLTFGYNHFCALRLDSAIHFPISDRKCRRGTESSVHISRSPPRPEPATEASADASNHYSQDFQ